ncbi:MAG: tail fiber protein [Thermoguttaceae bacterium]|nr:tail fiber protein [Thermoguttaceae bacterium]MDW8037379.1 tail fiber protein [Thermoguttaceae bacterium]
MSTRKVSWILLGPCRLARVLVMGTTALLVLAVVAWGMMFFGRAAEETKPPATAPAQEESKPPAESPTQASRPVQIAQQGLLNALVRLELTSPPIGTVMAFAGPWPPKKPDGTQWTEQELGWLLCDGRALPIPKGEADPYWTLFHVIGDTYGKTETEFRLPDLRSRAVVGAGKGDGKDDQGKELPNRTLAAKFGASTHQLSVAEMPKHDHEVNDPGHDHTQRRADQLVNWQVSFAARTWCLSAAGRNPNVQPIYGVEPSKTGITLRQTGESLPHNITQPSIALHWIIKFK